VAGLRPDSSPKGAKPTEVRSGRPEDRGGVPNHDVEDRHSTTGTTPNDTFVGRVAGDDSGYLETGAEKRAEHSDDSGDDPDTAR
jgi:hypothetical protein